MQSPDVYARVEPWFRILCETICSADTWTTVSNGSKHFHVIEQSIDTLVLLLVLLLLLQWAGVCICAIVAFNEAHNYVNAYCKFTLTNTQRLRLYLFVERWSVAGCIRIKKLSYERGVRTRRTLIHVKPTSILVIEWRNHRLLKRPEHHSSRLKDFCSL